MKNKYLNPSLKTESPNISWWQLLKSQFNTSIKKIEFDAWCSLIEYRVQFSRHHDDGGCLNVLLGIQSEQRISSKPLSKLKARVIIKLHYRQSHALKLYIKEDKIDAWWSNIVFNERSLLDTLWKTLVSYRRWRYIYYSLQKNKSNLRSPTYEMVQFLIKITSIRAEVNNCKT